MGSNPIQTAIEKKKKMDADLLERFTDATNRSRNQTLFLYDLVDRDFGKLVELEEKIKNNFLPVPGDKEAVDEFLALETKDK